MNRRKLVTILILGLVLILGSGTVAAANKPDGKPTATLLAMGLEELQGSTIGPGGDLYVTAPLTGSIWRVDPRTGAATRFATGLPARFPGLEFIGSGVVDVAFLDGAGTAFATLVLGLAIAGSLAAAISWSDASWGSTRSWYAAYSILRGIIVVVTIAVVGVAITLALRSTIATVGLAFGYAMVGEAMLRAINREAVEPWLLSSHMVAFLNGELKLYGDSFARRPEVTVLHLQTSALYLGALMLVLLVVSWLTFRRRDIA